MAIEGNIQDLADRVVAKARAEADARLSRAHRAAEHDFRAAGDLAESRKQAAESAAAAAVENRRRSALAELALRERRAVMAEQESVVDSLFAEALRRLREHGSDDERKALLIALAGEGAATVGARAVRLRFAANDLEFVRRTGFPGELDGIAVSVEDAPLAASAGGVQVSDEAGRVIFDNTFKARLERRKDALRSRAAESLGLLEKKE
ncbi:MAG: hypothetical protein FJ224_04465 [Lentisphaerae bacterium]|nr:hypothetical protein [Lentisphaerota bacterium]